MDGVRRTEADERPKSRRMDLQRISKSLSLNPSRRKICPAAMEATRVALAARAEYSRRRPQTSLEKAAFLIVTRDGDERLDELEMAVIHDKSTTNQTTTVHRSKSPRREPPERTNDSHPQRNSISDGTRKQLSDQDQRQRRRFSSADGDSHHHNSDGRRRHHHHRRCRGSHSVLSSSHPLSDPSSSASVTTLTTGADDAATDDVTLADDNDDDGGKIQDNNSSVKLETAKVPPASERKRPRKSGEPRRLSSDRWPQIEGGWPRVSSRVVGLSSSSSRASVLRFAAASVVMLTGTCAFVASYVVGRRETWTLVGSAITSISCLLLVIGVCCHLANTRDRSIGSPGSVEIRVVDQEQLAKIVRMGLRVEDVTI